MDKYVTEYVNSVNNGIENAIKKLIERVFPYEEEKNGVKRRVEVSNIRVVFPNPGSMQQVSDQALTYSAQVYGDAVLKENDKVLDQAKNILLMSIPVVSPMGTFIVDGVHYHVPNQLRLKPATYTRVAPDGTLEAHLRHVGIEPMILRYDPQKRRLRLVVGGRSFPFISLMRALGVNESVMAQAIGRDAYAQIAAEDTGAVELEEFGKALIGRYADRYPDWAKGDIVQNLVKLMQNVQQDPEVNRLTLGIPASNAGPSTLLLAARALLRIARGEQEPSGYDSLVFKKVYAADNFYEDKTIAAEIVMRKLLHDRLFDFDTLDKILLPGYFSKPFRRFITTSSASQVANLSNPLAAVSQLRKISLTGEGAVEEDRAITPMMRMVDPYYLGFIDPVHTPETDKIGAVNFLVNNARVDSKTKELKSKFWDVRKREMVELRPIDLYEKYVALPGYAKLENGQVQWKGAKVLALHRGKFEWVDKSKVDYIAPDEHSIVGPATASLPFFSSLQANRAMMASKHLTHAVPLAQPEAPLVYTRQERELAKSADVYSPVDGKVVKITDGAIQIQSATTGEIVEVPLFKSFNPVDGDYWDYKLLVSAGDEVKKGQKLAESNFTKDGTLALGANLRVAYMPYKGYNYEDAYVISESAAKKLASVHASVKELDLSKARLIGTREYASLFPGKYTAEQLARYNPDGTPKVGAKFERGEPLILAVKKVERTLREESAYDKLKQKYEQLQDASVEWDEPGTAEVVRVVRTGDLIRVFVKTVVPAQVGDKIVGRHGNKGTIALVLPDSEMPRDEEGKPIEVLYNPIGVPSRINPSQILETVLGKVAAKTGKRYEIPLFNDVSNLEFVKSELKKAGLKDKERVTDPHGEPITEPVLVGVQYFVKLPQRAETKTSIRKEWGYDADLQPLRGSSEEGAARAIDPLTFYSMLAAGAKANLSEMANYKSSKNDEFWLALELGLTPPAPQPTFTFEKFRAYLKAAGVNLEKKGDRLIMRPLKQSEIPDDWPEPEKPALLDARTLKPVPGGLFDPDKFGGIGGKKWGVIKLPYPAVNPVFDNALMLYLGLKREDYEALKEGKMGIDKDGNLVSARSQNVWKVGNDALMELVKRQKEVPVEKLKEEIMKADPKEVGGLVKKYRIALAMRDKKVDPMDFFVTKVPILPPQFRTAYEVENTVFVSPVNYGYRNLIAAKDQLQQLKQLGALPETRYAALASRTLNKRMEELMFAVPTGESALEPKGIMTTLTGAGTPKEGLIHGKLLKKRVELSSTGVIQSGPELGLDQVGLPKAMAFELYKPFIIRNLVSMGYSIKDAKEHIKNQTELATKVLLEEAARRPVIINRPPSLHKFNVLAMFPVITDVGTERGEYVVRMNPLVTKGYNADFDGDTVAVHVPATEEARIEAIEKLLPSKNLLKPATREFMPALRAEFIGAIYRITKMPPKQDRPVRVYTDWNQLYRDWLKNTIATDDLITFDGMDMTVGKALVLGVLPRDKRRLFMNAPVDSARQKQILSQIQNDNQLTALVLNAWKDVARIAMYRHPFTLGLDDLEDPKLNQVQQELKQKAKGKPGDAEELNKLVEQIDNLIRQRIQEAEDKNNLFFMAASGAKGDITQLRQFFVGPVLVTDTRGNPLAVPIVEDYPNGLSPDEYFATTFGARVGMVSKKLGVSEPGAMSKEYLLNVAEMVYVSNKQDPDNPGLPVPTNWPDKDLIDRVLARDVIAGGKVIAKAGEVITPKLLEAIRKENIGTIYIKSLLTDTSPHGVAADSYGLNEYGQLPAKGTNIGILETQAITEPLSQGTLNLFHTGSVAGHKGISNVLDEIKFYTRMPSSKESTAAVLALKAGRVKSINKLPTGGWNVVIDNYPHFVPADKQIIVKVGDFVRKGQPITDGPVHPAQLVVLRGPVEARFEIARRLVDIITQSGNKIRFQTVEPLVRAITSTAVVLDPGPYKSVLQEGELTTQQFIDKLNRQAGIEERDVDQAIGYRTAEMYGTVFPGTLIDEDIAKELKQQGFKKVKVYKDVVKYQLVMPGSLTQALYIGNPIASLATGRIKSTISDEAAAASSWNLNVPSQVAEWLVGSTRLL